MTKSVLFKLFLFSLIIEVVAATLFFLLPAKEVSPTLPFQALFFFLTSWLMYYMLFKPSNDNPNKFIRMFMLTTFLRFMFFILVIVAYVFLNRPDAVVFLITFFIFFILYLIFDVYVLLFAVKKK
jgi:hypothetical protein